MRPWLMAPGVPPARESPTPPPPTADAVVASPRSLPPALLLYWLCRGRCHAARLLRVTAARGVIIGRAEVSGA